MKRTLLILLACASFCLLAGSGQAQEATPQGPIRPGDGRPAFGPISNVYQLHYLKVSDTQPAQYVWLFHKLSEPSTSATEPETIFRSLDSPALLSFIAHLPPGVRIAHLPITPPSRSQPKVVGSNEPGLLDFIRLCRNSKIDFVFGTAF